MAMGKVQKPFDNVTTTNAYQYEIIEILNYARAGVYIGNTGTSNTLTYIIHGSYSVLDSDASWVEEVAATDVIKEADDEKEITAPFARIRIGVKSQTTDAHTTCDVFCVKKRY